MLWTAVGFGDIGKKIHTCIKLMAGDSTRWVVDTKGESENHDHTIPYLFIYNNSRYPSIIMRNRKAVAFGNAGIKPPSFASTPPNMSYHLLCDSG